MKTNGDALVIEQLFETLSTFLGVPRDALLTLTWVELATLMDALRLRAQLRGLATMHEALGPGRTDD